jgi:hypothetical protein
MDLNDIPFIDPHPFVKPLEPGEYYAAQRNGPAVIAKCLKHCVDDGYVLPERDSVLGVTYPYNTSECRRISKETYDQYHEKVNTEHKVWLEQFWRKTV